jgi:hypothetical protein
MINSTATADRHQSCATNQAVKLSMMHRTAVCPYVIEEEEGLQGLFKRLRRNGHQLEKGLQMAQRGPSLK